MMGQGWWSWVLFAAQRFTIWGHHHTTYSIASAKTGEETCCEKLTSLSVLCATILVFQVAQAVAAHLLIGPLLRIVSA